MTRAGKHDTQGPEPNWGRIANHLARRAIRNRTPLPPAEIHSLAGLAVAMSRARYDSRRATSSLAVWACGCGWLLLCTLIRDELEHAGRSVDAVPFTDLIASRATRQESSQAAYALQSALSYEGRRPSPPDWLDRLADDDLRIAAMRAMGATVRQIAAAHHRTGDWVRTRIRRMRKCLADVAPGRRRTDPAPATRTSVPNASLLKAQPSRTGA